MQEKGFTEVVLKAMGRAINKTVTIAEIIKRRIPNLHQITEISSTDITDVYEPLEEGLDRYGLPYPLESAGSPAVRCSVHHPIVLFLHRSPCFAFDVHGVMQYRDNSPRVVHYDRLVHCAP